MGTAAHTGRSVQAAVLCTHADRPCGTERIARSWERIVLCCSLLLLVVVLLLLPADRWAERVACSSGA
jgi:hypothetical protein